MSEFQPKIRVLIVDDSFFMRKLLRNLLSSDPDIEVVGDARDGAEALKEAARLKPDVITMDYQMPKIDGVRAVEKILQSSEPLPSIIMLSAYTREGAEETLRSLRAGAVDFIVKPSGELSLDIDKIKEEILRKIKTAIQATPHQFKELKKQEVVRVAPKSGTPPHQNLWCGGKSIIKTVVIGASTGGPPVIEDIIVGLPFALNTSILVAQHMPKHFTKTFAERLDKISKMPVKEAEEGDLVRAGMILVARGGYHMEVKRSNELKGQGVISFVKSPDQALSPSIDILMNSVAHVYVDQVIGVILTGMGQDGKEGMRAIKTVRGHTIVQDPETAIIASMPQAVIDEGLMDDILPPDKIVNRILELVG